MVVTKPTNVRLNGVPYKVIEELTRRGIYPTKADVIRAGLLAIGKQYGVIENTINLKPSKKGGKK